METEILELFNQITGHRHRETKDNLAGIKRVLKENYTKEEIIEVIQVKTMEWKNNPDMSVHLNPVTIFRRRNFDKYINQVITIKQNPQRYAKHFAEINQLKSTDDNSTAFSKINAMLGKQQ